MQINFSRISETLAERFPDQEAIVNVEMGRRITFPQYHLLTNKICNMMATDLKIERGVKYACILRNDNLSLMHFLTALKAAGTCCYANFRDNIDVHVGQCRLTGVSIVFLEEDLLATHYGPLRAMGITLVTMGPARADYPDALAFWDMVERASDANPDNIVDDREDIPVVRFTGGTTGDSKCAGYTADLLMASSASISLLPEVHIELARTVHLAPISHASGSIFLPTLFAGGCNVTLNDADVGMWRKTIASEQITHCFVVPTLAYRMLDMSVEQDSDFRTLKTMIYGASPMSPAKLKMLVARFGPIFLQMYGSTEHFAATCALTKQDHIFSDETEHRLASTGHPQMGFELVIANDDGTPVERGEIGEIWLRSRAVCKGYINNPVATEAEFVDGYWRSGDLAYRDADGYIYVVDRKKDMIISGGFNIYAIEIENAINEHPAVALSAVVGVPHEDWGEAVHAEVLLREGVSVDEGGLREFLASKLASYQRPKSIQIVDTMPLSQAGKVLRKDIKAKYWQGRTRSVG